MVDLLDTLGKFLISRASVFPQGIVTSLPGHRLYHYSDRHPSPGPPLTPCATLGKSPAFSKPVSSSLKLGQYKSPHRVVVRANESLQ